MSIQLETIVILLITCACGLGIGAIKVKGIGLSIGGVLFSGIICGYILSRKNITLETSSLEFIKQFGLVLFIYTIGMQVGGSFIENFKKSGKTICLISMLIMVLAGSVSVILYKFFGVSLPVALGLFAGAVTSTPSLGSAQQVLAETGYAKELLSEVGLAYSITYPMGLMGVFLIIIFLKTVLRINIHTEVVNYEQSQESEHEPIGTANLVVKNEFCDGLPLLAIPGMYKEGVVVSRMKRGAEITIPTIRTEIKIGDVLHLVGPKSKLADMKIILGGQDEEDLEKANTDIHYEQITVTNHKVIGKTLEYITNKAPGEFVISRVRHHGFDEPYSPNLKLSFADEITVVGKQIDALPLIQLVGNDKKTVEKIKIMPMFLGMALGVLLGVVPFVLPGGDVTVKLGLAGGPLIMAIVLARIGNFGPLIWYLPHTVNLALREFGLVLFLGVIGISSGPKFFEILRYGDGLKWVGYGLLITLLPAIIMGIVARFVYKENFLTIAGVISGTYMNTSALAFSNGFSPSQAPTIAYATAYPLATLLTILVPQIVVFLLKFFE